MRVSYNIALLVLIIACSCHANKPYNYKRFPETFSDIERDYTRYYSLAGCQQGEAIASIGAGNGLIEIFISSFIKDISWYLQEIDADRLYQFNDVLTYHEDLIGSPIDAEFKQVIGTEDTTNLPSDIFDRVLLINVFHEIEMREGIMTEVHQLLNDDGVLVIMERMGKAEGEIHGDCKYPRLLENSFLQEMEVYGYVLIEKQLGEEMSNLMFYHFESANN